MERFKILYWISIQRGNNMKKILPLLIIGILILNGLGAVALDNEKNTYKISESIHFSEPTIKQNDMYTTINIKEAASSTMETGKQY